MIQQQSKARKGYILQLKNPNTGESEWVPLNKVTLADGLTTVENVLYEIKLLREANSALTSGNIALASKYNNLVDAYLKYKSSSKAEIENLKQTIREMGGNV